MPQVDRWQNRCFFSPEERGHDSRQIAGGSLRDSAGAEPGVGLGPAGQRGVPGTAAAARALRLTAGRVPALQLPRLERVERRQQLELGEQQRLVGWRRQSASSPSVFSPSASSGSDSVSAPVRPSGARAGRAEQAAAVDRAAETAGRARFRAARTAPPVHRSSHRAPAGGGAAIRPRATRFRPTAGRATAVRAPATRSIGRTATTAVAARTGVPAYPIYGYRYPGYYGSSFYPGFAFGLGSSTIRLVRPVLLRRSLWRRLRRLSTEAATRAVIRAPIRAPGAARMAADRRVRCA